MTAPVDLDAEVVTDLSPSCILAYFALRETDTPQRTRDVARWTGMSERTVRYALAELTDAGVATARPTTDGDARGREYALRNGE